MQVRYVLRTIRYRQSLGGHRHADEAAVRPVWREARSPREGPVSRVRSRWRLHTYSSTRLRRGLASQGPGRHRCAPGPVRRRVPRLRPRPTRDRVKRLGLRPRRRTALPSMQCTQSSDHRQGAGSRTRRCLDGTHPVISLPGRSAPMTHLVVAHRLVLVGTSQHRVVPTGTSQQAAR